MMESYLLAILVSMVLITIINIILNKKSSGKIKWQHYLFGYFLILYLVISLKDIVGFPTLSDLERKVMLGVPIFDPVLNFIPLSSGIEISTILNIIFFMPFGFLLPTLWNKFRKFIPTVFAGFIFSLIIEVGMNTLGTILGFILFKILSIIFKKLSNKTMVEEYNKKDSIIKYGPYLYIGIAVISVFFS